MLHQGILKHVYYYNYIILRQGQFGHKLATNHYNQFLQLIDTIQTKMKNLAAIPNHLHK